MITASILRAGAPACKEPELWAPQLDMAGVKYGIDTPAEAAEWLAQLAHESAAFNFVVENLNYSAKGLRGVWPKRFPTAEFADLFARQPEKIANFVYANRMGNGPPETGDGWRYRGRGLIQLTGKNNYTAAQKATGIPLVSQPQLAATMVVAAELAGWFWRAHDLDESTDDIEHDTRVINGGLTGLEDRRGYWTRFKLALGK